MAIYQYPRNITEAARILDEAKPGWYKEIIRPLEMQSWENCVLGQVYGQYDRGMKILFGRHESVDPESLSRSKDNIFGMHAPTSNWYDEIEKRKNGIVDTAKPKKIKVRKARKPAPVAAGNLTKPDLRAILKVVPRSNEKLRLKLYEMLVD